MQFFNTPMPTGGKGDPSIISAGAETWIVPKDAKHPEIGADFFKFMTSLDMAKKFVEKKNTLMSIVDSDQVKLPSDLVAPAKCLRAASATWDADYAQWYRALSKATESGMAALLNGEVSPKECVDSMEKAAEETRKDTSIPKHKI
jgi:N-acetylglucosamine transport system substrate-binding protein